MELQNDPESVLKMKRLAMFSMTKFANHSLEVYDKFRNNFKHFTILLEQAKEHGRLGGVSADVKKKAENADEIQGKILNWLFVFSLSMVTDVYKVYRKISCILQKINILPHEKYDCFINYLGTFREMLQTSSYLNCPCVCLPLDDTSWSKFWAETCLWPRLHQDIRCAINKGTYMGINMGLVRQEEWQTRAGSKVN